MTTTLAAWELYSDEQSTVVQVASHCQYRVLVTEDEARITAPGLDVTVSLDEDHYPEEDPEKLAMILVLQLEGGVDL